VEFEVGQLVKYDSESLFIGIILNVSYDDFLNRYRYLILWNDGKITNGWMFLTLL
jgi:hypothetical protein